MTITDTKDFIMIRTFQSSKGRSACQPGGCNQQTDNNNGQNMGIDSYSRPGTGSGLAIEARSDAASARFGENLSAEERDYLIALIRRALMGADSA